jgi:hypothetical protein
VRIDRVAVARAADALVRAERPPPTRHPDELFLDGGARSVA